ncbi:type II secretion system F family protein [Acetobacterium sp.]|uniref:type II secretion system F family protein n=1 Tax=Acetobacterium sp. TaxID=1872094 RepID=UPI003593FA44
MDKQFSYKAKDQRGETITGTVIGQTRREAAQVLQTQNLIVLEISEKKKSAEFLKKEFKVRIRSVTGEAFSRFCRQFHIMLNAGIPILKCLELISDETENSGFAQDIFGVGRRIQSGESLSQAMMVYPKSFPSLFVFMVEAAEMSGNLNEILLKMAMHYETEVKNRRQFQQTLFYPMILSIVFVLVLIFLITTVLPSFVDMFAVMDAELPGPTRFLMKLSQELRAEWPIILLTLTGLAAGVSFLKGIDSVANLKDRMKIKLPLIGTLNHKSCLARLATTLGMLMESGVDLLMALNRLEGVTDNRYIKNELIQLREKVATGKSLSQGMTESDAFPSLFCQLVAIGEVSGSLPKVLETLNLVYADEVRTRIQLLNTSLEPLILLVFGGLVLFILAAIMLPVFDIYSAYSSM